ncbi:hypothetical protein B0H13DRAFT_1850832 [Mycena leptocephala]|nr:hypothetical protein B0H13DRAFT_1850832 [Mycena leptocephala]
MIGGVRAKPCLAGIATVLTESWASRPASKGKTAFAVAKAGASEAPLEVWAAAQLEKSAQGVEPSSKVSRALPRMDTVLTEKHSASEGKTAVAGSELATSGRAPMDAKPIDTREGGVLWVVIISGASETALHRVTTTRLGLVPGAIDLARNGFGPLLPLHKPCASLGQCGESYVLPDSPGDGHGFARNPEAVDVMQAILARLHASDITDVDELIMWVSGFGAPEPIT